jgi:enoyl-CoA hydratase/carnithine racemase
VGDYEHVLVDVTDGVATVTYNRPDKFNAFNIKMTAEFADAMWSLDGDDSVRAIIVTGAGKGFCSGVDLTESANPFGEEAQQTHDRELGVDSESIGERYGFWNMRTPVIAAINGAAIGAGLTTALLFDIRIAAEDAKLSFVFTRRGILPEANSLWLLPRLIGVERALELLFTGRTFLGAEAAELGVVSKAVPRDEVLPTALALARDIAANTAPGPVGVVKELVYRFLGETDRQGAMTLETKLTWWLGTQPDALEGVMSFLQKREPAWTGSKKVALPADVIG